MTPSSLLEWYALHEREWTSYEQLQSTFEWVVPDRFNIAVAACDRWADDDERVALHARDADGTRGTYTFQHLARLSDRLAHTLSARDVGEGDRVAVFTPQLPETAIAHLATWKLGAVTVPLSTLLGTEALKYRLADCGTTAAIVHNSAVDTFRSVADAVESLEVAILVDGEARRPMETAFEDAVTDGPEHVRVADTAAEDDAVIVYTSGTTGNPKGVVHAHRVLLGYLPAYLTIATNLELTDDDVLWAPPEWAWVGTLFAVVLPTMTFGASQLAYHADGPFDPEAAIDLIEEYAVTSVFLPPTALRMIRTADIDLAARSLGSMRIVYTGGEALDADIVQWVEATFPNARVHEGYGQTEQNTVVGDCSVLFEPSPNTLGKPTPGAAVRIVDPETAEPIDEPEVVGEIAVEYEQDPSGFKRYWNDPERTAEKVVNGWLLTEDLGSIDEDGFVTFEGRKDDVILSAGHRIAPQEIEESLTRHVAVADAGVIGVPDDVRGSVPKAYVVLTSNHEPTASLREDLQSFVKASLAKYEYPREIEFLDELPTTPTGKVHRQGLWERHEHDT